MPGEKTSYIFDFNLWKMGAKTKVLHSYFCSWRLSLVPRVKTVGTAKFPHDTDSLFFLQYAKQRHQVRHLAQLKLY